MLFVGSFTGTLRAPRPHGLGSCRQTRAGASRSPPALWQLRCL